MTKTYAGIDPGYKTGGVALLQGDWAEVHDLPVFTEGGLDAHELRQILSSVAVDYLVIEKQGARPKQGVSSAFKIGMGFGQILSAVSLLGIPHQIITRNQLFPRHT